MQIIGNVPDDSGDLIAHLSPIEAQLLGCLEDAWNDEVNDPPGKMWHHRVDLAPALRRVAAFAEVLTRANGLGRVVRDLDGLLRTGKSPIERVVGSFEQQMDLNEWHDQFLADSEMCLPWKETDAYLDLHDQLIGRDAGSLLNVLGRNYDAGDFDGSYAQLIRIARGAMTVRDISEERRKAILVALGVLE